mgnify:CR=1 FL=1
MAFKTDSGQPPGARKGPPPLPAAPSAGDDESLLRLADSFKERARAVREQVGRVIVGQHRVVEEILIALLAGGHVLLEGVPGLAKTLTVKTRQTRRTWGGWPSWHVPVATGTPCARFRQPHRSWTPGGLRWSRHCARRLERMCLASARR